MWHFWLGLLSFWMSLRVTPQKIIKYLESQGKRERENLSFVTPETVRASCIQLGTYHYRNLSDFLQDMLTQTKAAAASGAHIVVFPEYVGLLPLTLIPYYERLLYWVGGCRSVESVHHLSLHPERMHALLEAFHNYLYEIYMYTFSTLARTQRIYIVAGSCLFYEQGKLFHRSVLFDPEGEPIGTQDKLCTVSLDHLLGVSPSDYIEVFSTPMGKLAVILGSDAYYFESFQIARAKGAEIFAIPDSKSNVLHDLLRCRAEEYGVYILHACFTQGDTSPAFRTSILSPFSVSPQRGGVIAHASGSLNESVNARINLQKLQKIKTDTEPNHAFLAQDYLRSYRYCGSLPLVDSAQS